MIPIQKRYRFFIPGPFMYPIKTNVGLSYRTHRGMPYLLFYERFLIAVNQGGIPFFPSTIPLGLTVRILTNKKISLDVAGVLRNINRLFVPRIWRKPNIVALHLRIVPITHPEDRRTHIMISRMDFSWLVGFFALAWMLA